MMVQYGVWTPYMTLAWQIARRAGADSDKVKELALRYCYQHVDDEFPAAMAALVRVEAAADPRAELERLVQRTLH